jgi:hypothetical protein
MPPLLYDIIADPAESDNLAGLAMDARVILTPPCIHHPVSFVNDYPHKIYRAASE